AALRDRHGASARDAGDPSPTAEQIRATRFLERVGFSALANGGADCVVPGNEQRDGCWEAALVKPQTYDSAVDPPEPADPANPGDNETWAKNIVPVFSALLPSGKILYWDWKLTARPGVDFAEPESTRVFLWDPVTMNGVRKDIPVGPGAANLFCAGFTHLPNGDLLVAGGNFDDPTGLPDGDDSDSEPDTSYNDGTKTTFIFNWQTESWTPGPTMDRERWYPSLAALATGETLILGGDPKLEPGQPNYQPGPARPEVFTAQFTDGGDPDTEPDDYTGAGSSIRRLTNLNHSSPADGTPPSWRLYPFLYPSLDGRVLYLGPDSSAFTIDADGAGASTYSGERDTTNRTYGTWAPTGKGTAIVNGGDDAAWEGAPEKFGASKTGTRVESAAGGLTKTPIAEMSDHRRFHYLTTLPDGKVLATGGMDSTVKDTSVCGLPENEPNPGCDYALVNPAHAVRQAELYDPAADSWSSLASATRNRMYHSMAMLLPDGRVISGGGGICGTCNWFHHNYYEPNFEIFQPPYLWSGSGARAARPSITGATPLAAPGGGSFSSEFLAPAPYGSQFSVGYNRGGSGSPVSKAVLMKLGAPSHAVDEGQRYVPLTIAANNGVDSLTLNAPANGYEAPPGYYMIFLVNAAGVPSESKMIRIGADLAFANRQFAVSATDEANFGGTVQRFGLGTFSAPEQNLSYVGDDDISSLSVAAGYQATVCTGADGTGCVFLAPGNYPALGAALDDQISYLRIAPHAAVATDPAPPANPPAKRSAKPVLKLASKLKFGRKIRFKVRCVAGCTATATLILGKKKIKLKPRKIAASPSMRTITLKLPPRLYRSLKATLKRKKTKAKLRLRITLSGTTGRTTVVRKLQLR
ncbi:MAG: galactose oxidase-like domain-containing protein, partial [Solirubrobacterales bacterium]